LAFSEPGEALIAAVSERPHAPLRLLKCLVSKLAIQVSFLLREASVATVKSRVTRTTSPDQPGTPPTERHFLRSVVASKPTLQVGEPVRVLAKLRRDTPEGLTARIGRAFGFERYVSFDTPGLHRVPISVGHRDGRIDHTEIEFEVVPPLGEHPYPILNIRQDLTNPFLLQISLANADAVHRQGVRFQYEIAGYGSFSTPRPFFVVDCERLLNPTDIRMSRRPWRQDLVTCACAFRTSISPTARSLSATARARRARSPRFPRSFKALLFGPRSVAQSEQKNNPVNENIRICS
jgi:hypothetical protein